MSRLAAYLAGAVAAGACGGGPLLGGDGGPGDDAGPTADAFDLPDTGGDLFDIQFLDPDYGPFAGGTELTVRGHGYTADAVVEIGGRMVDPIYLEFIDDRRLIVHRTPPGDPGPADVSVTVGDRTTVLLAGFRYEAIQVSPTTGSVAGGTFITIQGLGTAWDETTLVTFDGIPATGVAVVTPQSLTCFTPPGTAGDADVRVTTGAVVEEANRGFTYQATADPFFGGMGGGPIDGTLNIVVMDEISGNGIPDAFVSVGDPATSTLKGRTDALGQITFSTPGLVGPVTVIAAADGYESGMFVDFDARDLSMFLFKPPPPATGPLPPGPQVGHIFGHILFGEAVGIGSPSWDLVPEPRTPTERKRAYVTTTASTYFGTSYAPNGWIEYEYDPDVTAWAFDVFSRPSAVAVVAIAGLYDPARDPNGTGAPGFEPFAMGVTRGVLVGPGEDVMNIDVVVNLPLDGALGVGLDQPPPLGTPGWIGPDHMELRAFLDLGGEGAIHMNKNGLPTIAPDPTPNIFAFPPGETELLLPGMAPLTGDLADAAYGFIASACSPNPGGGCRNPFSVRIARGYDDVTLPLVIDDFLPVRRPIDPPPDGVASAHHLVTAPEGPSTATATFHLHYVEDFDGTALWRIFTRGDVFDVDLPDLTAEGFPALPVAPTQLIWTFWAIDVPGADFDHFTYLHLGSRYWAAYNADAVLVSFPAP
jgi:hypothetical protein